MVTAKLQGPPKSDRGSHGSRAVSNDRSLLMEVAAGGIGYAAARGQRVCGVAGGGKAGLLAMQRVSPPCAVVFGPDSSTGRTGVCAG